MAFRLKIIATGAALSLLLTSGWSQSTSTLQNTSKVNASTESRPHADQVITRYTFRDVAKKVTPAVVNIKIKSNIVLGRDTQIPPGYGLSKEMRERLERLFDSESWNQNPSFGEDYKYSRTGSGVIIRQDGFIVTSLHVIQNVDGEDIEVSMPDGRTFSDIEIIGTDTLTDLAVIKIKDDNTTGLPYLKWGDSDHMEVGDHVVAVGNPLDFTNSVSEGIISAKHRTINKAAIEDLLQTTAMINPGNSGGALVNLDGDLIGINMAIATSTGMWSGLGFAIPSKTAKVVTDQIINQGKALRGYLGIQMKTLTIGLAKQLGYSKDYGIVVADVTDDSAAEKAGIQHYDIIASVNGNKVEHYSDMHRNIGNVPVGTSVTLEIWRDNGDGQMSQIMVPVVLGERPADQSLRAGVKHPTLPGTRPDDKLLGMKLEPAEDGKGLMVTEVNPKSPVEAADIKPGDVITEVNRQSVSTVAQFKDALKRSNTGSHLLYFKRDGTAMMQTVPGD